jgi:type VI secretion system protein ImpM
MQPSIDRVGRLFPLTVSAELPGDLDVLETIAAAQGWYRALERDAAAAFDPAVSLESIAARLCDLRFPEDALTFTDSADDTLPIVERSVSALRLSRGGIDDFVALRAALLEERVIVGHSHCVWMNSMSSEMQCSLLVTKTLPEPEQFCAFLDGRWEIHGWECAHAMAEPHGEGKAQG